MHLAGAASNNDNGSFFWRPRRGDSSPTIDLDGKAFPLQTSHDICSSTESLRLARHADERSSGKSNKSSGSGYLTMSCIKHEPSEDSDASAERPARPPKPARLSPARPAPAPLCEYVDVHQRPAAPPRCTEYELMANFASHARAPDDAPPAVPPRLRPQPRPAPPDKVDTVSNDDSLLDELQRDTYCVLKVCEDDPPDIEPDDTQFEEAIDPKEKEEYGMFSRISLQRKSNPIKTQTSSMKPLKTSNSTSNVQEAGSHSSRPLTERLTPFFLKKKPKPPDDSQAPNKCTRKEDNLIGRLTPRFGQSRLYGRGQSLEFEPRPRRIERSATTVNIPARPINSSILANLKFLTLHRYGAPGEAGGGGGGALLAATSDIRL